MGIKQLSLFEPLNGAGFLSITLCKSLHLIFRTPLVKQDFTGLL